MVMLMLRELTPEEKEFVKFVKTGKDQLWQENKRLKKALKTASRWLSQLNQCPYSFQCPPGKRNKQGECTDEIVEACFMEFWMSEEGSHEKPID